MTTNIGTDDIRKRMGEILDCVNLRGDEFIISRKNKEIAALIPVQKLHAFTASAKRFLLELMDKQGGSISAKEMNDIIEEAKNQVRK